MAFDLNATLAFFSWQTLWVTFVSLFAVWSAFFLPGYVFLGKRWNALSLPLRWSLMTLVGIAMWGVQAYVFGWLGHRWLSVVYVVVCMILAGKSLRSTSVGESARIFWKELWEDRLTTFLLILGSLFQLVFVIGSGWRSARGVSFWFLNAFDGVMHLAFTQELAQRFPPQQPGAVGFPLTNYHYWADLVAGDLSRVWGLPVIFVSFQLLPLVVSFAGSWILVAFVRELGGSRIAQRWALFFQYFAGNALWVFMLWFQRSFGWNLPAIDHGFIQFSNTPQAFAKFLFLAGTLLLLSWLKRKQFVDGVLAALMMGALFGLKIYFGLFAALAWTLLLAFLTLQKVRTVRPWREAMRSLVPEYILYGILGFFSLAVFLPPNKGAGGLFYVPFAWPRLLISQQYLNRNDWWLRRQVYEAFGNWKWLLLLDVALAGIFFFGVFGTRLLGVWAGWKVRQQLGNALWLFLFVPSILFIFIGMNFLQTSGEYNVFNFFIVALLPLSIFLSLWLERWKGWAGAGFALLLIVLSVPRPLGDFALAVNQIRLHQNVREASLEELELHTWLRAHTTPIELLQPHPRHEMDSETPWTPFFTNRQTYLSGTGILRSHNQPVKERDVELRSMYDGFSEASIAAVLIDAKVPYGILRTAAEPRLYLSGQAEHTSLVPVFANKAGTIVRPIPQCGYQSVSSARRYR